MQPVALAQQTSGAVPNHRRTDLCRSHDPQPRGRALRQAFPVCYQATYRQPLTTLAHRRKIPALLDPRRPLEPETLWLSSRHARLNRGQALTAYPAAIAQNRLATLARITVQKTVLPFAAHFRRLILSLHKITSLAARYVESSWSCWRKHPVNGTREITLARPGVNRQFRVLRNANPSISVAAGTLSQTERAK
jgi:hypothetical protein